MTTKEKATDLFIKYYQRLPDDTYSNEGAKSEAKQCALIAVDEIQKLPSIGYSHKSDASQYDYWQEVKQEIEKL